MSQVTATMGRVHITPDLRGRFLMSIDATGGRDACHWWLGLRSPAGYGRIAVPGRKVMQAHRLAWGMAHPGEDLPPVVRHTCDQPHCVNPAHLIGGTPADNVADMMSRGRHAATRGVNNPRARLTEDQVRRIAALRRDGLTYEAIAAATGARRAQVADIVTGRTWSHLNLDLPPVKVYLRRAT